MTTSERFRPGDGLVPLSERFYWSIVLRLIVIAGPIVLWSVDRANDAFALSRLLGPAVAYLLLTAVSLVTPHFGRGAVRVVIAVGTLFDGVWLAWALVCCGGLSGPVGYLVLVHVGGITLLASFRSGLKMAVWDGLVTLSAISASTNGLLGTAATKSPSSGVVAGYLAVLLSTALTVAAFAAVNERELRRRRYDAEALHRLGVSLEAAPDAAGVARELCRFGCEELLAPRALVETQSLGQDLLPASRGAGVAPDPTNYVAVGWDRQYGALAVDSAGMVPFDDLPMRALHGGEPLPVAARPGESSWLHARLPGAERVLVVPFTLRSGGSGVLVLDFTAQRRGRLDRRAVSTAVQATANVALALDRTALVDRLTIEATRDGLTSLANRRAAEGELARLAGLGHPFSVALFDLDRFKQLNDTFGHAAGDEALRQASAALRAAARQGDMAARFGGEELLVIMPGTDLADAVTVAEAGRILISKMPEPGVTSSVGVATYPLHGTSVRDILRAADEALYRAKEAGRDRVVIAAQAQAVA